MGPGLARRPVPGKGCAQGGTGPAPPGGPVAHATVGGCAGQPGRCHGPWRPRPPPARGPARVRARPASGPGPRTANVSNFPPPPRRDPQNGLLGFLPTAKLAGGREGARRAQLGPARPGSRRPLGRRRPALLIRAVSSESLDVTVPSSAQPRARAPLRDGAGPHYFRTRGLAAAGGQPSSVRQLAGRERAGTRRAPGWGRARTRDLWLPSKRALSSALLARPDVLRSGMGPGSNPGPLAPERAAQPRPDGTRRPPGRRRPPPPIPVRTRGLGQPGGAAPGPRGLVGHGPRAARRRAHPAAPGHRGKRQPT
jgi:hypothetical protein